VEATATETASPSNWSGPAAPAAGTATTAEASSATVIAISLRLPDQSRARKQRDQIEFSFHDFDFLCSLCFVVFEVHYFVGLTKTSRDTKRFACDPSGIRGSKKDRGRSDVAGLTDATEWCLRFNAFTKIALVKTGCAHAFGFDKTGIDGVDANFARAEFLGQRSGDGVDRAFGAGVD
jgi:hypothetical protein